MKTRPPLTLVHGIAVVAALLCAGPAWAAGAAARVDDLRIRNADADAANWTSHGRGYDEKRFSPLARINDTNVGQLGVAWTYKLDVDRGVEATPIVVDGVMYTTGAFSIVYALDARTGALLWKYDPKVPRAQSSDGCCDVVNRGVAVWQGKVYVGSFDGRLIALDAKSGARLWEVDTVDNHTFSTTITGAPRVIKGLVMIGQGGAELGVRGYLSAYDAQTGKLAWRFYTVPGDPKLPPENKAMAMARKTWFGDEYAVQGGGGAPWDSMAYDPKLDLLYFGTSNGAMWNYQKRSQHKGDNLFSSSIIAVRPKTGAYVWHYQTVPGDMWDWDATQTITLAELPIDGKPRKVLLQASKNGFFFVVDRVTGKLLSAAQYYPGVNWASHYDLATGRPVINWDKKVDWSVAPGVVIPGPLGAHNWQPSSFSPKSGLVYIPYQESVAAIEPSDAPFIARRGTFNFGIKASPIPEDKKGIDGLQPLFKGKLLAWDPVAQKAAWSSEGYSTIWSGGTMATAGNLVFQGTVDGRVIAYAADTGKKLWEDKVNAAVMGSPVTYEVDGEQYMTVSSGLGGAHPLGTAVLSVDSMADVPDSRVITYKLGGQVKLPLVQAKPKAMPDPPPTSTDTALIDRGRALYNANCSLCHGYSGVAAVLPDLRRLDRPTHDQFPAVVAGARADKGMPSFVDLLKPDDVDAIHQYLIKLGNDLKAELTTPAKP